METLWSPPVWQAGPWIPRTGPSASGPGLKDGEEGSSKRPLIFVLAVFGRGDWRGVGDRKSWETRNNDPFSALPPGLGDRPAG